MESARFLKDKFLAMKLNSVFSLKREKRYYEAERILSGLLDEYKDNLKVKKCLADIMVRQNRLKNALLLIDDVLCYEPTDGEAMIIKGFIYYREKRYRDAKGWFQSALKYRDSAFPLHMLIKCMKQLGENSEAICIIDEELKRCTDNVYILQLKAEIMDEEGCTEDAIRIYEQILLLRPENKFIYKELIRLKTGKMDRERAAKEIGALLKIPTYSKNEHLYIQQAENYKRQKRYDKAIESYRRGLEISPSNIFIKKQIGYCYNKLGRYEEVVIYLKDAFLEEPTDYFLRRVFFQACKKMNKRDELIELIEGMDLPRASFYYAMLSEAKR